MSEGVCSREFRKKVRETGAQRISDLIQSGKFEQAAKEVKKMKKLEDTIDGLCK